jgi:DNA-directed RNA polymerase subunit K/omega
MVPVENLTRHGYSVYSIVVGAAKRARIINDWRLQRARILYEETPGPKATTQALLDIADGDVTLANSELYNQ